MTLKDFYKLMRNHDWTYYYSDCNRTYHAGAAVSKQIQNAAKLSVEHKDLYQAFFDWALKGGELPPEPTEG